MLEEMGGDVQRGKLLSIEATLSCYQALADCSLVCLFGILKYSADMLLNVNMVEAELAVKNVEYGRLVECERV